MALFISAAKNSDKRFKKHTTKKMHISILVLLGLLFVLSLGQRFTSIIGPSGLYYAGPTLQQPTVYASSNGNLDITLTVQEYRHNSYISFNARGFACNGQAASMPSCTWKIKPGDNVRT